MAKRVILDFFQELEALDNQFFDDLDTMIAEDALEKQRQEEYLLMRQANAIKARRIYPRLKWLEDFDVWNRTSHVGPDFWGENGHRIQACRELHEQRERMRWFYRALYNYWMFDIKIPWATKWMGLRYSRHRKYYLKKLKEHKRSARRRYREARRKHKALKQQRKETLSSPLRRGEVPTLEESV